MKVAVVIFATIALVHSGSVRLAGWSTPPPTTTTPGWTTPPPTTTAGWTTLPPTTTAGWTTLPPPPPTTTSGWSPPPPPPTTAGWGAPPPPPPSGQLTSIDLNAALAAAGSGWAAENHADNVVVIGGGGWGPNAELVISSSGESVVAQDGSILQITSQDSESAASLNNVSVGQIAEASEGQILDALGLQISNAQSGWAGAAGEGSSAADATSSLTVNPAAASLGLARP